MKKLIGLVCIISCCFILCSFQLVNAAEIGTQNELLECLGIADFGYEYEDDELITRKSFMRMLAELLTGETVTDEQAFNIIKMHNLTTASDLDSYDGARNILTDEAVKMLVCLLGRDSMAQVDGGYPRGYYDVAYDINLLNRNTIVTGTELTKGQCRKILVNMLDVEVTSIESMSSGSIKYGSSDKSFLEYYRNIVKKFGIVEKNEYTSLYSTEACGAGNLVIAGNSYRVNSNIYNELLGCDTVFYANADTDEIVYAYPYDEETIVTIYDEDIVGISNNFRKFSYIKANEKTDSYDISSTVKVIYNNVFYKDYVQTDFKPASGYVRLIDSDGDEEFDVVDIHDFKASVVNYVSATDLVIASDYGNVDTVLSFEDYNSVIVKKDGADIAFSEIIGGNVLRIALSKNHTIAEIIVSDNIVTGIASSLSDEYVTINDAEYELADEFNQLLALNKYSYVNISLSREQLFYLDCFGKIIAVQNAGVTEDMYVYVFRLYSDDMGDDIYIKYMDINSQVVTSQFRDKVRVGNTSCRADVAYDILGGVNFTPQLLKIGFDTEGQIRSIKTATTYSGTSNDDFTVNKVSAANFRRISTSTYKTEVFTSSNEQKGFVDDDTIVFIVGAGQEDSFVGSSSNFTSGSSYDVELYDLDDYLFTRMVVCKQPSSFLTTSGSLLITKKSKALNKDNEVVGRVEVSIGRMMDYRIDLTEDDFNKVNEGDMVKFKVDGLGNATYFETTYSPRADKKKYAGIKNNGELTVSGDVKEISFGDGTDGRIKISDGTKEYLCPILATTPVDIYDVQTGNLHHGRLSDVVIGDYFVASVNAFRVTGMTVFRNIE